MIRGLSEFQKYKVLRPIIGECEYDKYSIPIIKKTQVNFDEWDNINVLGLQNIATQKDNSRTILIMFNTDEKLMALWNNPLKRVARFQTFYAIGTPDFSIYPNMNINDIRNNIYMSRWLGCTWQNYGCTVYPTIGWWGPETYDISFSSVEAGSPVIISTLGCENNIDVFIDGFNEMKRRIQPPLIIVYGNMLGGMRGTFVNFKYEEAFNRTADQLRINGLSKIFTI